MYVVLDIKLFWASHQHDTRITLTYNCKISYYALCRLSMPFSFCYTSTIWWYTCIPQRTTQYSEQLSMPWWGLQHTRNAMEPWYRGRPWNPVISFLYAWLWPRCYFTSLLGINMHEEQVMLVWNLVSGNICMPVINLTRSLSAST